MKTIKTLIAVITTVLVTALIISCVVPLDNLSLISKGKEGEPNTPIIGGKEGEVVPPGKTLVRFNLDSNARTLLPNTSGTTANGFTYYELAIHDDDAPGDVTLDPPFDAACDYTDFAAGAVALNDGTTYTITVSAYDALISPGNPAYKVKGSTTLKINDGGSPTTTINVALKEITNAGKGTFSVNLPSIAGYDTVDLTLATVAAPTVNILDSNSIVDLTGAAAGSYTEDVDSGFYRMIIEVGATGKQTVYVRETVHIYSGFTSTYITALPTLRSIEHKVTYNYGTSTNTTPIDETLNHGDVILDEITNKTPTHNLGSDFLGWYYDSALTKKVGDADLIIKPIDLYAKWAEIKFTLDLSYTSSYTIDPTGTSASYDPTTGALTLTLVANGGTGPYEWYVDYDPNPITTGNYPITTANIGWFTSGEFTLTVEDSNNHSDKFKFTK